MEKIGKVVAKKLWNVYKRKYPKLSGIDLFCIIFEDIVKERQKNEKRS